MTSEGMFVSILRGCQILKGTYVKLVKVCQSSEGMSKL